MAQKLPADFLTTIQIKLGHDEAQQLVKSLNEPPSIAIRTNPEKKKSHLSSGLSSIPWCANGLYLDDRPSFTLDPFFHAGAYYVQEPSSMFLEQFIDSCFDRNDKIRVLDLCAAPGGKSTHLLSLLNKESLLVSNEVIRSRAKILSENIQKWGHSNVIVTQNDPSDFKELKGFFDLIVVDAPCSGEGLFRKEPEAINEWSAQNVQLCAQRQKRILSDVYPALKENGILIYCTCTYNALENEENLRWLSEQQHVEFIKVAQAASWGVEERNDNGIIGYQLMPHRLRGEGFFISGIVKRGLEIKTKVDSKAKLRVGAKTLTPPQEWLRSSIDLSFVAARDAIRFFPTSCFSDISLIEENLNCVQIGTSAGEWKHHKFIPDHSLALSINLNLTQVGQIELSKEEAIRYLRKETLTLPTEIPKGYVLAVHNGVGLGWLNQIENRTNNLYPTQWRIRMGS